MSAPLDAAGGPAAEGPWMSTAPRGSSGRASGRRCWPTPNWPMGSSAGPTRAAYRSSVPDRRNGVCPGQHLHSHGRPTAGGHNQRWLRHLPMARQHLPVRRWQHRAQPGQHARAQLPDTHPERAHRGPRLHIGVADLSHRRGSSQKTPFCAPRTDPTEEAVPLHNGGSFVLAADRRWLRRVTSRSARCGVGYSRPDRPPGETSDWVAGLDIDDRRFLPCHAPLSVKTLRWNRRVTLGPWRNVARSTGARAR